LEVLAEAGIQFTIVAPHQVHPVPPRGLPGFVRLASGATIVLFVYDGPMSHDVAFGPLIRDGLAWSARLSAMSSTDDAPALAAVATDGETYGHHHPFGEMALVMMLERVREMPSVTVENFASFLARHGAHHEVSLVAPTSWSCVHGVERWRNDCGCRSALDRPTNQRWRAPLRDAISWLTAQCHDLFDRDAPRLLQQPAEALAGYGAVIGAGPEAAREYGQRVVRRPLGEEDVVRAIELLEMERGALRTLTSCAWFFDDIGGIETLQVLRYAAWVIGLAGPDAAFLEEGFTRRIAQAVSNTPALGTGRDLYLEHARPDLPRAVRITAGLAAARALAPEAATSHAWRLEGPDTALVLTSLRTGRRYTAKVEYETDGLDLRVTVRSEVLDGPVALRLPDLPERQRTAIAAVLRGQVLTRLLTRDEHEALDRGDELRPVIRHALARRVRALAAAHDTEARHAVSQLLTILEQLGQAVPFEVQTIFYRIWQGGFRDDPGMISLARRMGFDVSGSA
jgi:hypothetical protein